jgi:hypothetical protein
MIIVTPTRPVDDTAFGAFVSSGKLVRRERIAAGVAAGSCD